VRGAIVRPEIRLDFHDPPDSLDETLLSSTVCRFLFGISASYERTAKKGRIFRH